MAKVRAVILAILVAAGMVLVPATSASANTVGRNCHHSRYSPSFSWWEESFVTSYNSGGWHYHRYKHSHKVLPYDHYQTRECGKVIGSSTLHRTPMTPG